MPGLIQKKEINVKAYVFIDLSNFLSFFREVVVPKNYRNKWNWREPGFGRAFGRMILDSFNEIPIDYRDLSGSLYDGISYVVRPFRIYIYGSYTREEARTYRSMTEELKPNGDVISYLILRSKKRREKTVDVRLAVDMLTYAIGNKYDIAILVSGDNDFIPVVEKIRDSGKKIYVSHFRGYVHHKLIDVADRYLPIDFGFHYPYPYSYRSKTSISLFPWEFILVYLNHIDQYNAYFIEAFNENIKKLCDKIECSHEINKILKEQPSNYNSFRKRLNEIESSLDKLFEELSFKPIEELILENNIKSAVKYTKTVTSVQRLLSRLILQYGIIREMKSTINK